MSYNALRGLYKPMSKTQKDFFLRTVLVVDDEEINRQLLGTILEQEYDVIYAENGKVALEQLKRHEGMVSLVLLDLLMPEMDGYAVIEAMRADAALNKVPIIVLTSEKSAEIKSLQLGAADFLSKPYDLPEVILARVRHSIKLFEDANIIQATENDMLTRLYTREFFFEYASQYDSRHPELAMDAIVLNFNRFHLLNELHGRAFGDTVLCTIADGIRAVTDAGGGIACRYDADTFYLYIPHRGDYGALLEGIHAGLASMLKAPEIRLRMGVYADPYRAFPLESRFDRALQACNSLRSERVIQVGGRGQTTGAAFAIYDDDMHEREVYNARLLDDFEAALKQKQFKVSFQPKFNIKGEKPVLSSAEALVSWQHPQFGRVRPDAFIPLFEANGFIKALDRYVWQESARQMKAWKAQFGFYVPVSVNVSRVDMYDPDMVQFIKQIVDENGIKRSDYLLEVTESAYTDNSVQIVQVVNQLRAEGFRIEMDDFGSGYSSLNMLATLPIDALKLDMAFIRNISLDNKEMRMVELVLDIAEYLGVPVIAEGVETKDQYELLKKAGCDIIQGYYFSRPVLSEEFVKLLAKKVQAAK